MTVDKPPRLRRGGRIGVIAPAGCVSDERLADGIEAVRKEGFQVELSPHLREVKGYLAGDAGSRARDLMEFFARPDIDAVFCARGGFGSVQLLAHLDHGFRARPKIFVGYSDITVLLNWFLQQARMVTFHAPMIAMDLARGLSTRGREFLWGVLTGETRSWEMELGEIIRPGTARAAMMGGCLSLVVTTLGTPHEIDSAGKLLFLEDIGEKPYRIERMLTHLKMAGKLDRPAGVVFGSFTDCNGEGSRDLRQIVAELFRDAPYPVAIGVAAGHGEENLTLPFGVPMVLDSRSCTLSLLESPVI